MFAQLLPSLPPRDSTNERIRETIHVQSVDRTLGSREMVMLTLCSQTFILIVCWMCWPLKNATYDKRREV